MTTQATPREWTAKVDYNEACIWIEEGDQLVVAVPLRDQNPEGDRRGHSIANMITAAPKMLYACITAAEVLHPMLSPCEPDCECVLHLLDDTIAAARGYTE